MFQLQVIVFAYIWQSCFSLKTMKLEQGNLYINFPTVLEWTSLKKLLYFPKEAFQNIVNFRSPINSKSQDLTKFKSGTSHITHHTIHITYYIWTWVLNKILRILRLIMFLSSKRPLAHQVESALVSAFQCWQGWL